MCTFMYTAQNTIAVTDKVFFMRTVANTIRVRSGFITDMIDLIYLPILRSCIPYVHIVHVHPHMSLCADRLARRRARAAAV